MKVLKRVLYVAAGLFGLWILLILALAIFVPSPHHDVPPDAAAELTANICEKAKHETDQRHPLSDLCDKWTKQAQQKKEEAVRKAQQAKEEAARRDEAERIAAEVAKNADLQKSYNYLFTGDVDGGAVVIDGKDSCIVIFAGKEYYFRKMNPKSVSSDVSMEKNIFTPNFGDPFVVVTKLKIEGDDVIVNYKAVGDAVGDALGNTGFKNASIVVHGDVFRTKKALSYIFSQCPYEGKKLPF